MDFLDPKEKRKRGIRLVIGYGLMSILVLLATAVLLFRAYGFELDRRGHVVQNGLVFFDSVPDGASIFLNGTEQGRKTNVRLSLQEGPYSIQLRKDGYLPWSNRMDLEGGRVERFYYPFLVPEELDSRNLDRYKKIPDIVLQSPDRRWLLVNKPGSIAKFTRYDLNKLDSGGQPADNNVNFPAELFTDAPGAHRLKLAEWSTDNKNVLIKHSFMGGDEFIILDHDKPADSVNLDKTLGSDLPSVKLRDKKADKLYVYSQRTKVLSTVDLSARKIQPFLRGVLAFNPHGGDNVLYTRLSSDKQNTRVVLQLGDKKYVIKELEGKPKIDVDLASFDGDWYPVFTVASEKKAYVYKNPQDVISSGAEEMPAPVMVLKLHHRPEYLSFSGNASKVMISSGQEFSVYDIEYDHPYRYTISQKFDLGNPLVWMDGHRLLERRGGKVFMFDFDGKNRHVLAPAINGLPAAFDRDYKRLYTIKGSADKKNQAVLLQTDLRIPADL